jgi:hypothetical protein
MLSDSCHSGTIAKPVEERVIEYSPYTKKSMPLDIISSVYLQNKAEYDIYIDEVNLKKKDFKEISASVILISGCQDNQSSYDGVFNSKFTERLLQVWNGGKFTDNHAKFHAQISLGMPSYQSPNFFYAGKRNIAFENQIPFTINDQKGGPTFLIDLSSVALGEDLTKSIDDAIQKAVSGELAKASAKGKITLIPISGPKGGPGGGITMGYRL